MDEGVVSIFAKADTWLELSGERTFFLWSRNRPEMSQENPLRKSKQGCMVHPVFSCGTSYHARTRELAERMRMAGLSL